MMVFALLVLVMLPGVGLGMLLVRQRLPEIAWIAIAGAFGILWSVVSTVLLTLAHVPLSRPTITVISALPLLATVLLPPLRTIARMSARTIAWDARRIVLAVLTVAFLAIPFLAVHDGLPTGDVQKSLFWAQEISLKNRIPNYAEAIKLNRDPTDFATPGLHTITAAVGSLSGNAERGSAWLAFVASVILAGLTAALAAMLVNDPRAPALAFLFLALNVRFLRYAFSPGYHYQNLLGEIVLLLAFLTFLLALAGETARPTRYALAVASIIALLALPLVHQFTAFLAVFLAPSALLTVLFLKRASLRRWWLMLSRSARQWSIGGAALAIAAGGALVAQTPLVGKLPDLFTTTPHLMSFLISPLDYPSLLGPGLVLFGLMGMLVSLTRRLEESHTPTTTSVARDAATLLRQGSGWAQAGSPTEESAQAPRSPRSWRNGVGNSVQAATSDNCIFLVVWTMIILLLGQGPRFFIDVPSARVLFYAALPLAVFASFLLTSALRFLAHAWPRAAPASSLILVVLALAPLGQTAARELGAVSHQPRVNATLTHEMITVLEFLRAHPPTCTSPTEAAKRDAPTLLRAERFGRAGRVLSVSTESGKRLSAGALAKAEGALASCADAILVDDWNRRRLTWTILSPYRMLTRVGGDLRVIAEESAQSPLRKTLYDAYLDFEKIFMAGNSSFILPLLEKHEIALVGTANNVTDDVFRFSPLFGEVFRTEDVTLFARKDGEMPKSRESQAAFLLAPTTLVNDVGDREDVLPHTALSIASTRLTEPALQEGNTTRTIESEVFDLRVNVDTYVRPLWDADRDRRIDHPLKLFLRTQANGARVHVTAGAATLGTISLPNREGLTDTMINIPQSTLMIDEEGFATITFTVNGNPLILDLAALGIPQESP